MSDHPKHSPKMSKWPEKIVSNSYKILIVEDSESDRALYRRFLSSKKTNPDQPRQANYQLVEVETGAEGLNWCQQQMPDLFLIDYFLPDMTGLEFLVKLRQQTRLKKIPAIVLTSQGSTEIAVELLKNGAEDYLDKNQITEDNLQRAVSGVLKQFKLLQQLQKSEAEREEGRFWRQVLNSLFSYVGILSPDGIFLEANQAPLVITGLTKESVIGKPLTEVYTWLEPTEAQTTITQVIEKANQGDRVRFELSITTADHNPATIDFTLNPLYDNQGRTSHLVLSSENISDRKQIAADLSQLAAIVESSSDAIISQSLDDKITSWNREAEKLSGYSHAEVIGKPIKEVIPLDYWEEETQIIKQILQGKKVEHHETERIRRDGTHIYISVSISPIKDKQGKVVGISRIARDISDHKRAEKILKKQIRQEQLLFNVSQTIRQSLDLNNILGTATKEVKEVLQVDRAAVYRFNPDWTGDFIIESVDSHWTKLVGTDNPIIWTDTYLQEYQGGRFRNHESFVINDIYQADLQPCHIKVLEAFQAKAYAVSAIFSGDSLWGLLGVYQNTAARNWQLGDIDLLEQIANQMAIAIQQSELYEQLQIELKERQQIERELKQAKEQYELAIKASTDGFWDWNLVTNEIYYSPRWKEILGYQDQELPNKIDTWSSLIFAEDYQTAIQLVDDYNTGKCNQFSMTQRFRHKDGSTVYLISSAIHIKDNQGKVIRMIGTHSDITEMMKIQHELQTSKQYLQIVTEQLAFKIEELEQRNQEMLILSEMNDFIQSCMTVEEACFAIMNFVESLFPDFSGGISILDNSSHCLESIAVWGDAPCSEALFYPNDCWALRRGRIHEVESKHHPLFCNHINHQNLPTQSLCIPMIAQGETLGLFHLCSQTTDPLTDSRQQLARTIAEQTSTAIANLILREKLQNQSIRDPLTGLFNRRYLEEYLNKEIHRAARQKYPIGIIMIDLDHFKQINDTFGHDTGDFILKEMGIFLQNNIRSSDTACRYGGEEMLLILSESSLDATAQKAEEIRIAITQMSLNYQGHQTINLTSSFGVACFPDQGITINEIIHAADIALYQAKEAGRNRVRVASI